MRIALLVLLFSFFINLNAEWFGKDKVMHFCGSAAITFWSYNYLETCSQIDNEKTIVISAGIPLSLGFCKELSDKKIKKTEWSWHDIAWNSAGICLGLIISKNCKQ
ncbi:MAG: hypothetical protein PHR06_04315 [Candidatus Cloacimonetes bacterium]|nr:hypothetical protein [Candidatus Cloacimonadota bacterium]